MKFPTLPTNLNLNAAMNNTTHLLTQARDKAVNAAHQVNSFLPWNQTQFEATNEAFRVLMGNTRFDKNAFDGTDKWVYNLLKNAHGVSDRQKTEVGNRLNHNKLVQQIGVANTYALLKAGKDLAQKYTLTGEPQKIAAANNAKALFGANLDALVKARPQDVAAISGKTGLTFNKAQVVSTFANQLQVAADKEQRTQNIALYAIGAVAVATVTYVAFNYFFSSEETLTTTLSPATTGVPSNSAGSVTSGGEAPADAVPAVVDPVTAAPDTLRAAGDSGNAEPSGFFNFPTTQPQTPVPPQAKVDTSSGSGNSASTSAPTTKNAAATVSQANALMNTGTAVLNSIWPLVEKVKGLGIETLIAGGSVVGGLGLVYLIYSATKSSGSSKAANAGTGGATGLSGAGSASATGRDQALANTGLNADASANTTGPQPRARASGVDTKQSEATGPTAAGSGGAAGTGAVKALMAPEGSLEGHCDNNQLMEQLAQFNIESNDPSTIEGALAKLRADIAIAEAAQASSTPIKDTPLKVGPKAVADCLSPLKKGNIPKTTTERVDGLIQAFKYLKTPDPIITSFKVLWRMYRDLDSKFTAALRSDKTLIANLAAQRDLTDAQREAQILARTNKSLSRVASLKLLQEALNNFLGMVDTANQKFELLHAVPAAPIVRGAAAFQTPVKATKPGTTLVMADAAGSAAIGAAGAQPLSPHALMAPSAPGAPEAPSALGAPEAPMAPGAPMAPDMLVGHSASDFSLNHFMSLLSVPSNLDVLFDSEYLIRINNPNTNEGKKIEGEREAARNLFEKHYREVYAGIVQRSNPDMFFKALPANLKPEYLQSKIAELRTALTGGLTPPVAEVVKDKIAQFEKDLAKPREITDRNSARVKLSTHYTSDELCLLLCSYAISLAPSAPAVDAKVNESNWTVAHRINLQEMKDVVARMPKIDDCKASTGNDFKENNTRLVQAFMRHHYEANREGMNVFFDQAGGESYKLALDPYLARKPASLPAAGATLPAAEAKANSKANDAKSKSTEPNLDFPPFKGQRSLPKPAAAPAPANNGKFTVTATDLVGRTKKVDASTVVKAVDLAGFEIFENKNADKVKKIKDFVLGLTNNGVIDEAVISKILANIKTNATKGKVQPILEAMKSNVEGFYATQLPPILKAMLPIEVTLGSEPDAASKPTGAAASASKQLIPAGAATGAAALVPVGAALALSPLTAAAAGGGDLKRDSRVDVVACKADLSLLGNLKDASQQAARAVLFKKYETILVDALVAQHKLNNRLPQLTIDRVLEDRIKALYAKA